MLFQFLLGVGIANNASKLFFFFFQNTAKDRITHFNISVTVKHRRDNEHAQGFILKLI